MTINLIYFFQFIYKIVDYWMCVQKNYKNLHILTKNMFKKKFVVIEKKDQGNEDSNIHHPLNGPGERGAETGIQLRSIFLLML